MLTIHIESTSLERMICTVTTTEDPSAAPPEFSITPVDITEPLSDPAAWENGSWFGSWDADKGRIEAVTPMVGRIGAADLEVAEGFAYEVWIRWTAGSDQPVRKIVRLYAD